MKNLILLLIAIIVSSAFGFLIGRATAQEPKTRFVAATGLDKSQQDRLTELERIQSAILQTLPDKERCRIEYDGAEQWGVIDLESGVKSYYYRVWGDRVPEDCVKYLEKTESTYKIP